MMLTQKRLKELLSYDPETGEWRWIMANGPRAKVGDAAGSFNDNGYRQISIDGKKFKSARLAVLYMTGEWPKRLVDHGDTNRANDRWENLREATRAENNRNRKIPVNNSTGVKGVTRRPSGKYCAQIVVDGRHIYLGQSDNLTLAGYMYAIAAAGYHGEFARAS